MNLGGNYEFNNSSTNNINNTYNIQNNGVMTAVGTEQSTSSSHYRARAIFPGLGYALFINSKVSLEAIISYTFQRHTSPLNSTFNIYTDSPENNIYGSATGTAVNNLNGIYYTIGFDIFL